MGRIALAEPGGLENALGYSAQQIEKNVQTYKTAVKPSDTFA